MRAGFLVFMLSCGLVAGCNKQTAKPAAKPIPMAVLASFEEEKPSSTAGTATNTQDAGTPPAMTGQTTPEPHQETKTGVEKTLQRNQQILEGLVHRLVTSQPSAE